MTLPRRLIGNPESQKYERMAPIANGLASMLQWGTYGHGEDVSRIHKQIKEDLRSCTNYTASFSREYRSPKAPGAMRNVLGQCTREVDTKTMFCACCKFPNPEVILDNLLVHYFTPFYNDSLYEGVSLINLVSRQNLESIEDLQTLLDFQSGRFEWPHLVTRHLSRLHWRAVRCEQERMLDEWAGFMRQVNDIEREEGLLSMSEDQRTDMLTHLLPGIPGEPEDGGFLYRREWAEKLREGMTAQVKHYFSQIGEDLAEGVGEEKVFPYPLCDILDNFMMHAIPPAQTPVQEWLRLVVIDPEIARRRVNACRENFPDELPAIHGPSPLIDLTNFHSLTGEAELWSPRAADLRSCKEVIEGNATRTMWVKYGGDCVLEGVKFITTERFLGQKVLQELLVLYRFEGCTFHVLWLSQLSAYRCDFRQVTFAVAIRCKAVEAGQVNADYRRLFEKCCVSGETQWSFTGPGSEDEFCNGFMVIAAKADDDDMEW
jgi:hypothetical protein